ncbi:MAG: ABC transporter ATP-binding protein [Robiginitomaculum sp.]|nr:ABC transporter ATP-binding protein [Robiginitomaculum sp.]MDQ7077021.1 ABC transporter ATP-binding protein [Robiginitomaculum sp.]
MLPHWPHLILAIALMVLVAAANSLYPVVVRWAVTLLEARDPRMLGLVPAGIIALSLFKAISLYGQTLITNAVSLRITAALQNTMFGHLLGADYGQISAAPAGQWVSRLTNDINLVREALSRALTNLVRDALTVMGAIAFMIWVDWLLALLVFTLYPLAAFPVTRIGKAVRALSAQAQAQLGRLTALLTESLSGVRMIKVNQLEAHEQARAARSFEERRRLSLKLISKKAQVDPMLEVAGGIAFAAVLAFAGWRASGHGSPIANLIGFISALAVMAPSLRAIGTLSAVWQEGAAALDRIFALLDTPPKITEGKDAKDLAVRRGDVSFEDVSLSYGEGQTVLHGINFTVQTGQTLALVGPSGAGKTSVLNLIPRLYDPDSGQIRIDDTPIDQVTLSSLRRAMALVSQDAVLFDGTIRENIAFGRLEASQDEIEKAARQAAAHEFILEQPEGYDTPVGERGHRLSGGQRQRIALARALLKDAPILLLDEATSALDAETQAQVQKALESLSAGRTTIMIAHRLSSVMRADHILVLEDGRVVEEGNHKDLMKAGGLYARLAKDQFNA